MSGFLPLILAALFFIGLGIYQLATPLDNLWARHERHLLARGLAPQRNDMWEAKMRSGGWIMIVVGIALLLFTGALSASMPKKMSGVSINGHELTQAEWDSCDQNMMTCLNHGIGINR